jgi:hypothetical protein
VYDCEDCLAELGAKDAYRKRKLELLELLLKEVAALNARADATWSGKKSS